MSYNHSKFQEDPRSSWTIVLVVVQFACLGYLVFTGPLAASSWPLLSLQVAALGLGVWAVAVMRPRDVNVAPVVRPGAKLITRGPYRLIRHPMYTSLLLLTTVWVANDYSPKRLAVLFLFAANMVTKVIVEERYLKTTFDAFDPYRRKTWRIIPFVF